MGLISWANSKIRTMNWLDIQAIKIISFLFALFIISIVPMSTVNWVIKLRWLWLVLVILIGIKPITKMFRK